MTDLHIDALRITMGFLIILILAGLAAAIAVGRIEEHTSYGLMPLIVALSNIGVMFAQWAFSARVKDAAQ
jgi:hypothetical protein